MTIHSDSHIVLILSIFVVKVLPFAFTVCLKVKKLSHVNALPLMKCCQWHEVHGMTSGFGRHEFLVRRRFLVTVAKWSNMSQPFNATHFGRVVLSLSKDEFDQKLTQHTVLDKEKSHFEIFSNFCSWSLRIQYWRKLKLRRVLTRNEWKRKCSHCQYGFFNVQDCQILWYGTFVIS